MTQDWRAASEHVPREDAQWAPIISNEIKPEFEGRMPELRETCLLGTVLQMADVNLKAVRLGIVPPSSDDAWASAE